MICSAIKCNILLTLFFIFGVSVVLAAQTKPVPQVISSGGKHMENDKTKIDSTSGEIIVETKGVNTRPTQGFQQPRLQLMTPVMQLSFEGKIKVFPNPVKTSLTVVIEAQGKFDAVIYDLAGRPIVSKEFSDGAQLDMTEILPGAYGISLYKNGDAIYSSIIIKMP